MVLQVFPGVVVTDVLEVPLMLLELLRVMNTGALLVSLVLRIIMLLTANRLLLLSRVC